MAIEITTITWLGCAIQSMTDMHAMFQDFFFCHSLSLNHIHVLISLEYGSVGFFHIHFLVHHFVLSCGCVTISCCRLKACLDCQLGSWLSLLVKVVSEFPYLWQHLDSYKIPQERFSQNKSPHPLLQILPEGRPM